MKKQITNLSPHQNGKIFGILIAVGTFLFLLFILLISSLLTSATSYHVVHFPKLLLLIFPFMYLIFGYILVASACLIYNYMAKYTGGFEFEIVEKETSVNSD